MNLSISYVSSFVDQLGCSWSHLHCKTSQIPRVATCGSSSHNCYEIVASYLCRILSRIRALPGNLSWQLLGANTEGVFHSSKKLNCGASIEGQFSVKWGGCESPCSWELKLPWTWPTQQQSAFLLTLWLISSTDSSGECVTFQSRGEETDDVVIEP